MKLWYLSAALLLISVMSCRKAVPVRQPAPFHKESFHKRAMGSSAREFLSDQVYKSLVVEIDYIKGYKPRQRTLDNLRNFLETYLNKPKGIAIVLHEIGSTISDSLSMREVAAVENKNRNRFVEKDKISMYILFTNGMHPTGKILGMAYQNSSAVVYGKAIRKYSSRAGRLTHDELETAVLLHEVGHLIGLVNKGSESQEDHDDPSFQDHCMNKNCLMFHSVETKSLSSTLLKGNIPALDSRCIEDLIANGGKNTPGYDLFIKPQ